MKPGSLQGEAVLEAAELAWDAAVPFARQHGGKKAAGKGEGGSTICSNTCMKVYDEKGKISSHISLCY